MNEEATSTPAPEPLCLRQLLEQRRRFGAYARLVQTTHEVRDGVYPALLRLQRLLDEEVAPALAEPPDPEFAALLVAVRTLVASPARLIEALLGSLAQYRELLPDLLGEAQPQPAQQNASEGADGNDVLPGPGYRAEP